MTHADSGPVPSRSHGVNWSLVILLCSALALRLYFKAPGLLGGDAIGFAVGGLGTWIAHPPGYFGFCFLSWLVNQLFGNINQSILFINITSCMVGIWACYRFAKAIGLSEPLALLGAAAYAFSINTVYYSDVALSYSLEGMLGTLIALTSYLAIKRQSLRLGLLATFIWAISGAFRQNTIVFLLPLWLYTLWRSRQFRQLHWHLLIAIPIVTTWYKANQFYLNAASGNPPHNSTIKGLWTMQVMTASDYDPSKLGMDEDLKASTSEYHWPFVEVLAWLDEKVGTHLLPSHTEFGAPAPDLGHATRLTGMQAVKLSFYTLFSIPGLLVSIFCILFPKRKLPPSPLLPHSDWLFFAFWIVPSALFFLVGHCGPFGYQQIYLSGLSILSILVVQRRLIESDPHPLKNPAMISYSAFSLAGLLFFTFATPYQSSSSQEKLLDVLALQYSGPSIKRSYSVARSNTSKPGPADIQDWVHFRSDAEIVHWWEKSFPDAKNIYRPHTR